MQEEKQQQLNISELLDDITYVNQANKAEIKRVGDLMRSRIAAAKLPGKIPDSLIKELSGQLGQLSAQVKMTEKLVRSNRHGRKNKTAPVSLKNKIKSNIPEVRFGVEQLAGTKNLLPIESTGDGVSYVWSSSDPEIRFSFNLDRSKSVGMKIRLFALIKPEFSKQLKILIDGTHINHRFSVDEGLFVLSCTLAPSIKSERTEVKIVLPATHSPMELGPSRDDRKLGVAITEICFGKPEGGLNHLLKRLKISS